MIFGFGLMFLGYALFYWGLHHFPQYANERYSFWCLLGIGGAKSVPIQINPGG